MSKRGESKSQKRISAPLQRLIKRKQNVFTERAIAGPHNKSSAAPLSYFVRDILLLGQTMFEVKKVLNSGTVLVNGVQRKEPRFPVGIFDLLEVGAEKKKYRAVFDRKGRFVLSQMPPSARDAKISKILFKKAAGKGILQLTTNDGLLFNEKGTKLVPGDSVMISLPDKKIVESFGLKEGHLGYVVGGTKKGSIGKITDISLGTKRKPSLVSMEIEGTEFRTIAEYVFVIGAQKPAIELGSLGEKK